MVETEQKFEVEDTVECIENNNNRSNGSRWVLREQFQITEITMSEQYPDSLLLWDGSSAIYSHSAKLVKKKNVLSSLELW